MAIQRLGPEHLSKPKVSIIIPVFNTRPYLEKCLDSLTTQTLQEIEIICIDNGSTDGSYEFIQEYAKHHANMIVYRHAPGRQGGARNAGIEVARGEFIGFVDSDDFVSPGMFRKMIEAAQACRADVVVCNFEHYYDGRGPTGPVLPGNLLTNHESFLIQHRPRMLRNLTPWNKLYSREFLELHKIRFPVDIFHEDNFFVIVAFVLAKRIVTVPEPLYYYRRHRPGSVNEQRGADSLSIFNVMQMVSDFIDGMGKDPSLELLASEVKALKYLDIYNLTGKSVRKAYFEKMKAEFKAINISVKPCMISPSEWRAFQFVREHEYSEYNLFLSFRTAYGWFRNWMVSLNLISKSTNVKWIGSK